MERYRTSIHSHSPINRSFMTEGHIKSNLESRIEYENSQVSLISLIKVLAIASTLILLLIATKFYLDARARSDQCGKKITFGQYISRLRYRLFGGVNPDSCQKTVETIEDEVDGSKIEVVTKTKTCKTTNKEDDENTGFWSYLSLPFSGCEEYKAHEAALKNQKFSVKEGLVNPPVMVEVSKSVTVEEPLVSIENLKEITEKNSNDIKNKFDTLLGDYSLQFSEKTEIRSSNIAPEESPSIEQSKKLLEKPTIFDLQLKVNDLIHSSRNLAKKKQALKSFQDKFYNVTKISSNCNADSITELKQKLNMQNEKVRHSNALREEWEKDLRHLDETIQTKLRENANREAMTQIQKLKDEIEVLKNKKSNAEKTQIEINRRLLQISNYQTSINKLSDENRNTENDINDINSQIAALKRQLEELNLSIKMNENKRVLWEMKLELAQRNKHIKDFLLTLIDTHEGKTNDLQALFADKISSEKELKNMVKMFINQSRTAKNEEIISDEQIDSIIKQDEKDFNDITRLYTELVKVINEYKDIDFDILSLNSNIKDLKSRNSEIQINIKSINNKIKNLEDSIRDKQSGIDKNRRSIVELENKIARHNEYVSSNRINMDDIDRDIAAKTHEHEDLKHQWEV